MPDAMPMIWNISRPQETTGGTHARGLLQKLASVPRKALR